MRRRKGRSRVTNHKDLLPGIDGRTRAARRFRDLVSGFLQTWAALICSAISSSDYCVVLLLSLSRPKC